MLALVEHLAKSLVDQPEAVKVTQVENGKEITIHLTVAPEDMGKVIGKQGRIAKATVRNDTKIQRSITGRENRGTC